MLDSSLIPLLPIMPLMSCAGPKFPVRSSQSDWVICVSQLPSVVHVRGSLPLARLTLGLYSVAFVISRFIGFPDFQFLDSVPQPSAPSVSVVPSMVEAVSDAWRVETDCCRTGCRGHRGERGVGANWPGSAARRCAVRDHVRTIEKGDVR